MNAGAYRPALRSRVYAHLVALAQEHLKAGRSVILDATFLEPKWRSWVEQLARDMDADQIWVQCVCDRRTSLARLAKRERDPGASDARQTHFLEMERRAAPFVPKIPASHLTIRTDRRLSAALGEVLSVARGAKQAQIQDLL